MFNHFYIKTCLLIICIVLCLPIYASRKKETVNILTWWDYLSDTSIINTARKKCGVEISIDQYYSNDEFLRRWESQIESYQVIIFSNTIYDVIRKKLPIIKNSKLSYHTEEYNRLIKEHYSKQNYPPNIVYFTHSMTGFLWNPEKIAISSDDSIYSIFKKANKNYVVIMDDPAEFERLLKSSLISEGKNVLNEDILTIKNFNWMTSETHVYITNNYSPIYIKPDFAFSFGWSGEAILDMLTSNKRYKFFIHPKLSYIGSDLLAQTSSSRGSECVATFLSSKKVMALIQEKDFYFSPYTDYSRISNPDFRNIYKEFVNLLPTLAWINSTEKNDFYKKNTSWQLIKLSLNSKHSD